MGTGPSPTVLVVDDTKANVDLLLETLSGEVDVAVAMDGESALESVRDNAPDLILLDIMMPGIDGYEVCRRLKADPDTQGIPVIFLTAMSEDRDEARGLALGAVDYVAKPFNPELVRARVRNHLELKRYRDHLEDLVRERTRELVLTQEVTIESMGTLAEYRDPQTGGHIRRTQSYVRLLAERVRTHPRFSNFLGPGTIELLCKSAPLHDIGKVAVRDGILLKPAPLTEPEMAEMKRHTLYGRDAIMACEERLGTESFLRLAREIAYTHHERWDGTGYPQGLKAEQIPICGRLMALADVYDALISKRVYKAPVPHTQAVTTIAEGRAMHFDPDLVAAFLELREEFRSVALRFADHDEERRAIAS